MLIGPTFYEELRASNVPLDGIAWGEDGAFCFREDVTQATRAAVASVFEKHDPTKLPLQTNELSNGKLVAILVAKGLLTQLDVTPKSI